MPSGQDHAELPRAGEGLDSRREQSLHHWEIWETYGKILSYMILYVTHMFHVYIYIYILFHFRNTVPMALGPAVKCGSTCNHLYLAVEVWLDLFTANKIMVCKALENLRQGHFNGAGLWLGKGPLNKVSNGLPEHPVQMGGINFPFCCSELACGVLSNQALMGTKSMRATSMLATGQDCFPEIPKSNQQKGRWFDDRGMKHALIEGNNGDTLQLPQLFGGR